MWDSVKSKQTATLGGQYTAPYTADYEYFGTTALDEDLPMSIISCTHVGARSNYYRHRK